MTQAYLIIITISVVVATIFFILVLIELRTAIRSLRKELKEFLDLTENSLKPTLEEFQSYLKVARRMTENADVITEDIRVFSGSVKEIGENVRSVSRTMRYISIVVEKQGALAAVKISGLQAGIKAASQVLLKYILSRRNP